MFKGIDPNEAFREIERINAEHGDLTADILLNEARSDSSIFHKYFNWNDAEAAEKYRLQQARFLLNNIHVNVISDGDSRMVAVYEVVKRTDHKGSYKSIDAMTSDDVEYIRKSVLRSLGTYRNKLATYDRFQQSVVHLDQAITELESQEPVTKEQEVAA